MADDIGQDTSGLASGRASRPTAQAPAGLGHTVSVPDATSILKAAQEALWQYLSDLRFPPTGDSVERRLEMAREASSGLAELIDHIRDTVVEVK